MWAPGPVWSGAENLASTRIRSPDRPARSQSLYRLSYRAHQTSELFCYQYGEGSDKQAGGANGLSASPPTEGIIHYENRPRTRHPQSFPYPSPSEIAIAVQTFKLRTANLAQSELSIGYETEEFPIQ